MSKTSKVAWPIVVAVALVSFAGCQTVGYIQHNNVITTCIKSGGTWVDGVTDKTPDQCITGEQ